MFYFASDNPLARGIVSQLKTLKQAGFHPEANVIVHFDPNADNTPVHIFDVNLVNKIRAGGKHRIGFSLNPPSERRQPEWIVAKITVRIPVSGVADCRMQLRMKRFARFSHIRMRKKVHRP